MIIKHLELQSTNTFLGIFLLQNLEGINQVYMKCSSPLEPWTYREPLHTRAKSRDHEILWEPKRKCPKAVSTHLQNHVVWSRILKCSVKSYVIGPSTKCYFNEFLFMQVRAHDKIPIHQQLWAFGVPWSPNSFAIGLPPSGGSWK